MKKGFRTVTVAVAALVALVLAATAMAAYTSPRRQVNYSGTTTRIIASSACHPTSA